MIDFHTSLDSDDPRLRLAEATRKIISQLASSTAQTDAFAAARDLVERATAVLAAGDHGRGYTSTAEASLVDFESMSFVDYSPFIGLLNPLAPPISMSVSSDPNDTTVVGAVMYGGAYEGPPGCVHGGHIAGGFDEILGFAQARAGQPGMTARLTVSYRSPTPLHRELLFTGRVDRVDGRKIFATGELVVAADGRLCADAEGLFISVDFSALEALKRGRHDSTA